MLHGHGIFGPVPVSGGVSFFFLKNSDTVDTADPKKIQDFGI